ncbi:cobalamin biosynthesis protein [Iningainema tapete]|uniref:Cobalamin biosynthesis protein n=1 Tax=Iningainema tapete BLCC-T55 TaxID=2748662 RepID=A0A8J6XMC6_9CYAN|nr:cobalamin biosynthesis protein [Iningainema tapete]MBD2777578.1 cobalamin biosynthesis protein [Iningainema tapete BLCC-T55]
MSAISPQLWVGIGCVRGTSQQIIEMAIGQVFRDNQLLGSAIAGFATIDTKRNEVGLVQFCQSRNLPLKFFSADVLCTVSVPNPNLVVGESVGTPSVAEAAALCAVSFRNPVSQRNRVSVEVRLLVPKQVFRFSAQGMVTVAVAQSLFNCSEEIVNYARNN